VSTLPDEIELCLERLGALVRSDPAWSSELEASLQEFSPGGQRRAQDPLFRRRHLEWFLLERAAGGEAETALERAARRWPRESGLDRPGALTGLRHSRAGIFEVSGVQAGAGLWLSDLGGAGEFPVEDPDAAAAVRDGDVIAGRIFPADGGAHRISGAAAHVRDARVLAALKSDLREARRARRGVLRVGQRELEAMFWAAEPGRDDPVGDARALLARGGVEPGEAEAILESLGAAPFDEQRVLHGAADVLGEVLDRLAFDTSIDLDEARRTLVHAWASLAGEGPGSGPRLAPQAGRAADAPGTEVALALRRFEERRKAGEPLAALLDELELELGLAEPGENEEEEREADGDGDRPPQASDEDDAPVEAGDPGEVAALVAEFLWQEERESGPAQAARHAWLRSLPQVLPGLASLEDLGRRELAAFAAAWLPDSGEIVDADSARARLASLIELARWAESEQQVPLGERLGPLFARLSESLPRIAQANQQRTREAPRGEGRFWRVEEVRGERAQVADASGARREAQLDPALAAWLRPGDRLRGSLGPDGRLAVYACYPPEIAELES
jgi:hypothetical protein